MNLLIAGNNEIDINLFLDNIIFENAGDKLDNIKNIITQYAIDDPTYLNEFLFWITGKKVLPHNGFKYFNKKLKLIFVHYEYEADKNQTHAHVCPNLIWVTLPDDILENDEILKEKLSKEMIKIYSNTKFNAAGGA